MTEFKIIKYNDELFNIWDNFVKESVNGNIYHTRKFLSYHSPNKFIDESILIYKENIIVCVLPCCKNGDTFFSHKGATYGGPVFSENVYNIKNLNNIIELIFKYYDNKIEFRIANSIYNNISDNVLLYLLSKKLKMIPELAWYINKNDDIINNIANIRNKKYIQKMMKDKNFICDKFENEQDYIYFYEILKKNLNTRYNTEPTHTLDEFLLVKKLLDKDQSLYLVKNNEIIYGGVYVIKVTNKCWYTFYISKNIDIKTNMSVVYLMHKIQQDAKELNIEYIDYGITTEDRGEILNIGLAEFKETSLCGKSSNRYLFLL